MVERTAPEGPAKWRIAVMGFPGHWRFMGPLTAHGLRRLADIGFNAVALWVSHRVSASCRPGSKIDGVPDVPGCADWWNEPETLERIAAIGEMCRASRLRLFATLYACSSAQSAGDIPLPTARSEGGAPSAGICPVAPELWRGLLLRQALAWAPHVDGVLFDLEVQVGRDAAGTGYWRNRCCCDRCMADFLGGPPPAEAAAQPRGWLERAGQWDAFTQHQTRRAFEQCAAWREGLRAARPGIRTGFYGHTPGDGDDGWRDNQVARALHTPGSPLLLLDSATYWECCARRSIEPGKLRLTIWDWEKRQRDALKTLGVEADVIFGCFTDSPAANYSLKEIERHAFICATRGDGYWVWNERRDPVELQNAYHAANQWLDLLARDPDAFFASARDRVRCAEEHGLDTAHARRLLARADALRAAGDAAMAAIMAYQANWCLGR